MYDLPFGLLVLRHGFGQLFQREGRSHRQTALFKVVFDPGRQTGFCDSQVLSQAGGQYRPNGYGFPVGQVHLLPAGLCFQSVGKGMAKIQFPTFAFLVRVTADDAGLDIRRGCNQSAQRIFVHRIAGIQIRQQTHGRSIGLGIAQEEGFQHLGRTAAEIPLRKRLQGLRTDERPFRLPDDAQHVLQVQEIDTGFSADGRIYLGQKGRRDEGESDAAFIDGRRETGHVRRNAAADGQQQGLSVRARFHHRRTDLLHGFQPFRGFGDVQGQAAQNVRVHLLLQQAVSQLFNSPVADDEDIAFEECGGFCHLPACQDAADGLALGYDGNLFHFFCGSTGLFRRNRLIYKDSRKNLIIGRIHLPLQSQSTLARVAEW